MSGFTPKFFSVKRFCGPANTSIHQCIGIRKEFMKLDLPRESGKLLKKTKAAPGVTFPACF